MKDESVLVHCEHVSERKFDEVVAALEQATGVIDAMSFRNALATAKSPADFEAGIRAHEGPSGFMRFFEADHGAWMSRLGAAAKCKLYVLGNPLIAWTMLRHDLGAGLNVPLRVLIYEDRKTGKTRFAYDLPSSLMARLANEDVAAAARRLDEKLAALARAVTGADA